MTIPGRKNSKSKDRHELMNCLQRITSALVSLEYKE